MMMYEFDGGSKTSAHKKHRSQHCAKTAKRVVADAWGSPDPCSNGGIPECPRHAPPWLSGGSRAQGAPRRGADARLHWAGLSGAREGKGDESQAVELMSIPPGRGRGGKNKWEPRAE